ncbi:hypothetical protein GYA27_04465 [candidate division WWE3 bacterium]|uniref:Uncharacterized protein n=1 Tax=candidate division WWE3 bacterium TaxID=2053526 RepID=A0A7X9HHA1_UNCKA|nr:hypothetical protein [candidate division WWE3 bacterium]
MKLRVRLIVLLIFIFAIALSGFAVLRSEQEKRLRKYLAEKDYYSSQYNAWLTYKKEYQDQITRLAEENRTTMAKTKADYEMLLAQQSDLIKEHTRTQLDGTQNTASSQGGSITSSNQTSTQTVKVTRPVSKPKTRTS